MFIHFPWDLFLVKLGLRHVFGMSAHHTQSQHQDVGALSVAHHGVRLPGGGLSIRHDGSIEAQ